MTDILDDRVDELLQQAERRLRDGAVSVAVIPSASGLKATEPTGITKPSAQPKDLSVREAVQHQSSLKNQPKATAGRDWFDLPRTQMTPEFKRDWQLLRMRGVLDPKHQKKALRASAPEFSHVGEIIAGPTDFFSARLTRKERKRTLLEEVMSVHDNSKFEAKYAGIQKQKSSGKKAFYNKVVTQRRKRRN